MAAASVPALVTCLAPRARPARSPAPLAGAWQPASVGGAVSRQLTAHKLSAARTTSGAAVDTGASDDRSRDFASSLALMVLGAALISERINGQGLVAVMELDHPGIEPLLWGIAGGLAVAAAWPAKARATNFVGALRHLAGRLAFAGLAGALGTELYTGNGLLALLEIETGAEALTDAEAVLAALAMLVLTGPRRGR